MNLELFFYIFLIGKNFFKFMLNIKIMILVIKLNIRKH